MSKTLDRQPAPEKRPWKQVIRMYFSDQKVTLAGIVLKRYAPSAAAAFGLGNDALLPFIGMADNLFAIAAAAYVAHGMMKYRDPNYPYTKGGNK